MTYSVNGNLIVRGEFPEYDIQVANEVVSEFMRTFGEDFTARYYSRHKTTNYTRDDLGEGIQPFITVFDKPESLSVYKDLNAPGRKRSLLFVEVSSGSHIGISDTKFAQEIVSTSLELRNDLQRHFGKREIELYFDDEHRLYLPRQFQELIREAAA